MAENCEKWPVSSPNGSDFGLLDFNGLPAMWEKLEGKMADSKTVFVVIRSDGEYSDRIETVIGYFADEAAAQEFCTAAEREWKEAAAQYPGPPRPQMPISTDFDIVWPEKVLGTHQIGAFGSVTMKTHDYSQPGTKVMCSDEERARRVAVREDYYRRVEECRTNRKAAVTLDKTGNEESSWYYEAAKPLA